MISEATRKLTGDLFAYRELGRLAVVGRKEPVTVYEPMQPEVFEARKGVFETFYEGLTLFYNGEFERALGNLDQVAQVVKLTGFVNATADFPDHPKVINGASDFMVEVFGDKGRHTRAAVGVSSLPMNCAVEIDAILRIER